MYSPLVDWALTRSLFMEEILIIMCSMPTFMIFKEARVVEKVQGADPKKLQAVVKKLAAEAEGGSSGFGASGSGSAQEICPKVIPMSLIRSM
jgi:hypothetical protein